MLPVSTAVGQLVVSGGPLCVTAIAWTGSLKTTNTQTHCIDKAAFAYHSCQQHYFWLGTRLFKRWSLVCVQATPQSLRPYTLSGGLDVDLDDWEPENSTCRIMAAMVAKKKTYLIAVNGRNQWMNIQSLEDRLKPHSPAFQNITSKHWPLSRGLPSQSALITGQCALRAHVCTSHSPWVCDFWLM